MLFDGIFAARRTRQGEMGGAAPFSIMRPPVAGVRVDEHVAMTYSAVFACVAVIADSLSMLPWRVYRHDGDSRVAETGHQVNRLLTRRPNEEMTPMVFKETLLGHALLWGNGYAELERNGRGDVVNAWILTPDRVNPDRDGRGRLVYEVANGQAPNTTLRPEHCYHLRGLGWDGIRGYSVVSLARETISLGLATQEFGAAFFGNGAWTGGVITQEAGHGKPLGTAGVRNLLSTWNRKNKGARNSFKTEFLDAGMKYQAIGVPPEDAQFLETRNHQVLDVCRWFRVPPHKLAQLERATHTNIESQNIEFVTDCLMPWATRMEEEGNAKLFIDGEDDLYTKFNMNALLRGDSKARAELYKTLWGVGAYDIDEIRALEDKNPLPNGIGKLRMVPMNHISVESAYRDGGTVRERRVEDRRAELLLDEPAARLARKECNMLERVIQRGADAAPDGFYEAHLAHLVQTFRGIGQVLGIEDIEERALALCRATQEQLAERSEDLPVLLEEWRALRAATIKHAMGATHV